MRTCARIMAKNIENSESELSACIQEILRLRNAWLDLTGGDLVRGVDLLECNIVPFMPDPPADALSARFICRRAILEWCKLGQNLVGWALAASAATSSKKWREPKYNTPSSHARRSKLISELSRAWGSTETYAIAVLPKEIALELKSALEKLEFGEVDSILEPAKRKNYKDGWTIPTYRERIVCACHYYYGSGLSMTTARRRIAEFVGEHFETIRNWDRGLQHQPSNGFRALRWRIAGAAASGATFADACRRLGIDPESKQEVAEWDHYVKRQLRWDDAYLAKLGQSYQRALREQKQLAQRRKR
jgi:hypothetical protein